MEKVSIEAIERFLSKRSGDGSGDGSGSGSGSGYGISEVNGKTIYLIDGLSTALLSIKGNVAKGEILSRDLSFTPCFVVKANGFFAHGDTLRAAMNALTEKLFDDMPEVDRIAAFIKEHPDFTAKYSNRDLYDWHHRLTGSCEMGRNAFARGNQISLDDSMSVAEFVLLTQNAYGGSTIKKLPEAYRQSKNL